MTLIRNHDIFRREDRLIWVEGDKLLAEARLSTDAPFSILRALDGLPVESAAAYFQNLLARHRYDPEAKLPMGVTFTDYGLPEFVPLVPDPEVPPSPPTKEDSPSVKEASSSALLADLPKFLAEFARDERRLAMSTRVISEAQAKVHALCAGLDDLREEGSCGEAMVKQAQAITEAASAFSDAWDLRARALDSRIKWADAVLNRLGVNEPEKEEKSDV